MARPGLGSALQFSHGQFDGHRAGSRPGGRSGPDRADGDGDDVQQLRATRDGSHPKREGSGERDGATGSGPGHGALAGRVEPDGSDGGSEGSGVCGATLGRQDGGERRGLVAAGGVAIQRGGGAGRNAAADDRGMGVRPGNDALVSLGGLCAGVAGAGILRRAVLSRGLAAAPGRQLKHGHAGGAGFFDRVRLQRVGAVQRRGGAPVFHGVGGDHHADQPRALVRGAHEREGGGFVEGVAGAGAPDGAAAAARRPRNAGDGARTGVERHGGAKAGGPDSRWTAKSRGANPRWTSPC